VAGQVAFDSTGKVVGVGDFGAQTEQVYANLRRALASVGATFADVVKTTVFITDVAKSSPTFREIRSKYVSATQPPTNTLGPVPALARPDLLIEIEAIAVLRAPPPR
jgi:enamine deaminase RidA (YjgF/YER057c/UK114 family)